MPDERPHLLVAEDDSEIRRLIRERLESGGYRTHLVRNGSEAVSELRGRRFAGLLLDINMPQVDGFGVLRSKASFLAFPPTLMLTARHSSEDVELALELGAKDYLSKPFSEAQLMARVRRLIKIGSPIKRQAVRL